MTSFSIIVAVYNIEHFIDQCIESIISQNYDNFELILVNDGSTDNSLRKLCEWEKKDPRITIVNKKNGGLSSARNEGLNHATKDYVLFVDGDDWLNQDILNNINKFLQERGMVDILCFSHSNYYRNDYQEICHFNIDDSIYSGPVFFEKSNFLPQAWNKAYQKKFLDKISLYFLDGKLHEDISYTIPLCLCASNVAAINIIGYYYRQNRPGSIMATVSEKNVLDFANAIAYGYHFLVKNKIINEYYLKWVVHFFLTGCFSFKTSFKVLKRSLTSVGAPNITAEISTLISDKAINFTSEHFFMVLWWKHFFQRHRYFIGRIIHCKRYKS